MQPQEVGDLGDTARARLGHALGKRIAALMEQPVDVANDASQRRVRADVEHRRHVAAVERRRGCRPAARRPARARAHVGSRHIRFLQELQAKPADLDQRGPIEGCVAILHLQLAGGVAREAVGRAAPRSASSTPGRRRAAPGPRGSPGGSAGRRAAAAADPAPGNRTACRRAGRRGRSGRRPCRARAGTHPAPARKAPGVRAQAPGAELDMGLQEAIVLLQMLRLEERALGPEDPVVPAHRPTRRSRPIAAHFTRHGDGPRLEADGDGDRFLRGTAAAWRQREFSRSRNAAITPMNFVSG